MRGRSKMGMAAVATGALLATACTDSVPTGNPLLSHQSGVIASATGGGHFIASGADVVFAFSAVQKDATGAADGQMHFALEFGGHPIEFHGRVTCLAVDPAGHRAWIGGVVTRNGSTHPGFTTPIHAEGRDIWFRVEDAGEGSNAAGPDRTTFVGFAGSLGIVTSAEYCAVQPWLSSPSPVTKGNVQVRN